VVADEQIAGVVLTLDRREPPIGRRWIDRGDILLGGRSEEVCVGATLQAVDAFRGIWYYTVGEILVRAHSARRRAGERPWRDIDFSNFDPSRLPRLAALGDQWPVLASRDTYPQGLRAFVDGLLAQARPAAP
jgi:hypothetical protein